MIARGQSGSGSQILAQRCRGRFRATIRINDADQLTVSLDLLNLDTLRFETQCELDAQDWSKAIDVIVQLKNAVPEARRMLESSSILNGDPVRS